MTEKRAPSRWWYAVAAAVFVLGVVPIVVLASNAATGLLSYDVHEFDDATSTQVAIDGDPVAIYTTYDGVGTVRCNGGGPGADVPESAEDGTQATAVPLEHPAWEFTFTKNSEVWHRVAVTPDDWTDGTYQIACNLASPSAGNPQPLLGYADNPSVVGTFVGLAIALGVAGLAALATLIIVVVVAVKRSKANRPPLPTGPQFPQAPPPY